MPEIAEEGQKRLKKARVTIAGGGGLGSAACLYLAAAGIGHLTIIDHERVELSNLNR
jgi:molybdopterin/thiamine biosynthesis adenylyltransferase